MVELKEVVERVLLPLQLSLGLFQIMTTTPLWAVIHCTLASLLNFFHFPYTDYKKLKPFEGRVFKKVISHATTAGAKVKKQKDAEESKKEGKSEEDETVSVVYLGKKFVVKRMKGNKMLIKDGPAYYITDKMWEIVKYIAKVASETVFLKDHKEIWEEVITGDIMEFEEVLDSVILDNRTVIRLDHDYFLPVNLLRSEIKLTTTLNFVGLFLKTQKNVNWLIPALLTFTSAVMGFSTKLRIFIDRFINTILCRSIQLLCDLLPLGTRRWAYSWVNWVENLKPSNDLKSKIVRGTAVALVAAGASLDSESFADCEPLVCRDDIPAFVGGCAKTYLEKLADRESLAEDVQKRVLVGGDPKAHLETSTDCESLEKNIHAFGPFLFKCESKRDLKSNSKQFSVYIEWMFNNKKCSLKVGRVASEESLILHDISVYDDDFSREIDKKPFRFACSCGKSLIADELVTTSVDVECSREEAIKLLKFSFHMAKYKTTSLKSYSRKTKKVTVRRFGESINAYASSGYPPLYRLIMDDVIVR